MYIGTGTVVSFLFLLRLQNIIFHTAQEVEKETAT
jgi:hypothetical protein